MIKALAAGVPLVCLPHGRDQGDNAARVVALGAGLRLSRRSGVDALRAAARRVLDEPVLARNARRVADVMAQEALRGPSAVVEVEGLLGRTSGRTRAEDGGHLAGPQMSRRCITGRPSSSSGWRCAP